MTAAEVAWVFDPRRSIWAEHRFGGWSEVWPWLNAGFSAWEAGSWRSHRFDPGEAAEWRDAGFDAVWADEWRRHGWTSNQARQFRDGDVEPAGTAEWLVFAGWDRGTAARYAQFGLPLAVVAASLLDGVDVAKVRDRWQHFGFGDPQERKHAAMRFVSPEEASAAAT